MILVSLEAFLGALFCLLYKSSLIRRYEISYRTPYNPTNLLVSLDAFYSTSYPGLLLHDAFFCRVEIFIERLGHCRIHKIPYIPFLDGLFNALNPLISVRFGDEFEFIAISGHVAQRSGKVFEEDRGGSVYHQTVLKSIDWVMLSWVSIPRWRAHCRFGDRFVDEDPAAGGHELQTRVQAVLKGCVTTSEGHGFWCVSLVSEAHTRSNSSPPWRYVYHIPHAAAVIYYIFHEDWWMYK